MSDHNAINLKFLVLKSKPKHESKIPLKTFLNLDNPIIKDFFSKEVDSLLYYTFDQIIDANFPLIQVNQETINSTYSKISSVFKAATISTQQFQNLINPVVEPNLKSKMESKSIKSIKRSLIKVYGKLKKSSTPELESEYKVLKRDLRRCQRREKYLYELREVGKLEQVSKSKNRNLFWRFTKKMKKKVQMKKK